MNQEALEHARELLEELGLGYQAKIQAIVRLRERFSLEIKEAKDLVDAAYEELLAEEEEDMLEDDEDEELLDAHPEIIDAFVERIKKSDDHDFVVDAGFVVENL